MEENLTSQLEGDQLLIQQTSTIVGDATNPDTILVHQIEGGEEENLTGDGESEEVVQIVMQQDGGGNSQMVMPDGQMLQLDAGSDEVQYIQVSHGDM